MYGGDRSRKQNLVEYGFRLPSALDNRPLKFEEFETLLSQVIYVTATPSDYELNQSQGVVVEQLIRPTGLLDPQIEVKPSLNQIDDLLNEIELRTVKNERILVTTLTKRMAEELSKYMLRLGIRCKYIHSEVDTLDRVEILRDLRQGAIDVLIGVNLLREGLDLPEVSLVAILDADKEGFLRSEKSLTQTAGRAARNINSKVIFYADKMTYSMQRTIDETNRKRAIQIAYNLKYNITPTQIIKGIEASGLSGSIEYKTTDPKAYVEKETINTAADPIVKYLNDEQLKKFYDQARKAMEKAAKELDFIEAARLRDEMISYKELIDNRKKGK
jgi:excinuclease ABC subunit B